jgi:hypothetical protein
VFFANRDENPASERPWTRLVLIVIVRFSVVSGRFTAPGRAQFDLSKSPGAISLDFYIYEK